MYGAASGVREKEIKWKFGEFEGSAGAKLSEAIHHSPISLFSASKGYS